MERREAESSMLLGVAEKREVKREVKRVAAGEIKKPKIVLSLSVTYSG